MIAILGLTWPHCSFTASGNKSRLVFDISFRSCKQFEIVLIWSTLYLVVADFITVNFKIHLYFLKLNPVQYPWSVSLLFSRHL